MSELWSETEKIIAPGLTEQYENLKTEMDEMKETVNNLKKEKDDKEIDLKKEVDDWKSKYNTLNTEKVKLEKELENLKKKQAQEKIPDLSSGKN